MNISLLTKKAMSLVQNSITPVLAEIEIDASLPPTTSGNACQVINGMDSVLVLDISPSMEEKDYPPCRLGAAVASSEVFVRDRVLTGIESNIGVVGFGRRAIVACTLTDCRKEDVLIAALRSLTPLEYTNIAAGLETAQLLLESSQSGFEKEVILLSDGFHNTGSRPEPVAENLKRMGCMIHCVGIGGSPKAVDESLLKQIASRDQYGRSMYRFIADRSGLVKYFAQMGGLTR